MAKDAVSRTSLTEGAAEKGGVGSVDSGANGTILIPALLFPALMTVGKKLSLASNFLF